MATFLHVLVLTLSALTHVRGNVISYKEHSFRTKVDHFSFHNNKTFELRYLMDDQYWDRDGGPIFIYTGNENRIEVFATSTGALWEWAPEFSALVIFVEHRFFGSSLPFGDQSFESPHNLGYLSSDQALADYADLILHLKYTLPGAHKSPVVTFGGSYGAMLAAWMRLKYPHLVDAALASGGPFNMPPGLAPCSTYSEAVTKAYRAESEICVRAIRESWRVMEKLASTVSGSKYLQEKFKTCQPLHPANYTLFRDMIRDTYGVMAMANYPDEAEIVGNLPASPVKTCSTLMQPFCGNGVSDMFYPFTWNATAEKERCQREFGVTPDFYGTVMMYGGGKFSTATNIIFSNGELDPWSAVGIREPPSDDVVLLEIPGAAHHTDLRFAASVDSRAVKQARIIEKNYLRQWISAREQESSSQPRPNNKRPRVIARGEKSGFFHEYSF